MNYHEFQASRRQLGKTQKQLSELLGTSLKAVQSFEQGWRKVPVHIERQVLFLLTSRKEKRKRDLKPCWDLQNCSQEKRRSCPAWEFNAGNLCWFINGTHCEGKPRTSWSSKMNVCRKCKVFRNSVGLPASGKTLRS